MKGEKRSKTEEGEKNKSRSRKVTKLHIDHGKRSSAFFLFLPRNIVCDETCTDNVEKSLILPSAPDRHEAAVEPGS